MTDDPPQQEPRLPPGFLLRAMTPFDVPEIVRLEQRLFPLEAWPMRFFLDELAQAGPPGGTAPAGARATRDYRVVVRVTPPATATRRPSGKSQQDPDDGAGRVGEIVGYAGLMVVGEIADVQTIGVVPEVEGLGLGAAQLRWMIAEAGLRGATSVLLEVRADNTRAQGLYERYGFGHVRTRRGYYPGPAGGPRVDAWIMRRLLTVPHF